MRIFDDQPFINFDKTELVTAVNNDSRNHFVFKIAKYIEEYGELSQEILGAVGSANKSKSSSNDVMKIAEEAIDVFLVGLDIFCNIVDEVSVPDINNIIVHAIYRTNSFIGKQIDEQMYGRNAKSIESLYLSNLFSLGFDYTSLSLNHRSQTFNIHDISWKCFNILSLTGVTEQTILDILEKKITKWLNKTLVADYDSLESIKF